MIMIPRLSNLRHSTELSHFPLSWVTSNLFTETLEIVMLCSAQGQS